MHLREKPKTTAPRGDFVDAFGLGERPKLRGQSAQAGQLVLADIARSVLRTLGNGN